MKLFPLIVLLFLCLLSLPLSSFSQSQNHGGSSAVVEDVAAQIKGIVVSETNQQPLDYATVSLFLTKDSSLITGGITNELGEFTLDARPGSYFARVEFLAFQSKIVPNIEVKRGQKELDLGTISLSDNVATLNEVEVVAEKSSLQLGLDKKVFNVGKDLASQGGTASDLLDNVPTLQVDVEGTVSLRGSESVRILIDGRPSGLIGSNPAAGLRAIPANMIEKVEIITNPSARYEAEGMSGIINIILKKDRRAGFNGSFDFTLGEPTNFGTSFNLNYRANKFNFFANYGISYRKGPGGGSQYQELRADSITYITTQNSDRSRGGLNNSFRFGADYSLSPKSTLTLATVLRKGDDDNRVDTRYTDYINSLSNPLQIVDRINDEIEKEWRTEVSLKYRKDFEKKDHVLTADIRYQQDTEDANSDLSNQYFTPGFEPADTEDLFQRSANEEKSTNLIIQTDYVHPFGEDGRFELGLRSSIRNIDNDYLVEELQDNVWESLEGLSNDFRYEENISAAYFIIGNKINKLSWQIGIRPEYSNISTELLQTNEVNNRDYLNFFPSAFLGYELPGNNSIQVSYSRRVRRPRFRSLNPFFSFSDDRNFRSGNPNLDPEFTDAYEISYLKYFDKGSISSSIYYRHTIDKIERVRRVNPDNTTITQPENLTTQNSYGLEFTASYDPFKWWRMNADFNFFRAITDGGNVDASLSADTYGWFTRGTTRLSFDKKTDLQIRFNYRAPQLTTQGKRKSMYSIDLAASRDILGDKGTLTLSVRDLFNSRRYRYINESAINGTQFFSEGDFQWRARQITLTFNYRLNQKKRRGGNRERGGGGDFDGGEEF